MEKAKYDGPRCPTCNWCELRDSGFLACRFNPPYGSGGDAAPPIVWDSDWCSHHSQMHAWMLAQWKPEHKEKQ